MQYLGKTGYFSRKSFRNSNLAVLGKIKGISWSCENCEQKGQLPVTNADIDSLSDNIQSLNTHIQQELPEIRNDINQLKQNSCQANIEQLQNEIKNLEQGGYSEAK